MPIHEETINDHDHYCQWGTHGKQYHFNPQKPKERQNAYHQCQQQMKAIFSNGYQQK